MIHTVEIRGLRGIREGTLNQLTPLVVLVGPNACGKSTVLEALFMGASNTPPTLWGSAYNGAAASGHFVRVVPCGGDDNLLASISPMLAGRATKQLESQTSTPMLRTTTTGRQGRAGFKAWSIVSKARARLGH